MCGKGTVFNEGVQQCVAGTASDEHLAQLQRAARAAEGASIRTKDGVVEIVSEKDVVFTAGGRSIRASELVTTNTEIKVQDCPDGQWHAYYNPSAKCVPCTVRTEMHAVCTAWHGMVWFVVWFVYSTGSTTVVHG